jgi:predicted DNA binding CopG/RHH family protein
MKKRYDFSKSKPNPYLKKAKRQVTIRLDEDTIDYFKDMANTAGIPYQNLINLYLRECAAEKKRLKMAWTN